MQSLGRKSGKCCQDRMLAVAPGCLFYIGTLTTVLGLLAQQCSDGQSEYMAWWGQDQSLHGDRGLDQFVTTLFRAGNCDLGRR